MHDSLGICDELESLMADARRRLPRRVGRDHQRPGAAAPGSCPSSTRPTPPTRRSASSPSATRSSPTCRCWPSATVPGRPTPWKGRAQPMTLAPETTDLHHSGGPTARRPSGWFTVCDLSRLHPGPRRGRPAARTAARPRSSATGRARCTRSTTATRSPARRSSPAACSAPVGAARSSPRRCSSSASTWRRAVPGRRGGGRGALPGPRGRQLIAQAVPLSVAEVGHGSEPDQLALKP